MTRASGWRVPSVATAQSGLPTAWLDRVPDSPTDHGTEPGPADQTTARGETTEFGQAEKMLRPRRRWSFRRNSREPEPTEPDDIDLIALGTEEDRAWTDLTLAALEEPETTDDTSVARFDTFAFSSTAAGGPWSLLADEQQEAPQHDETEPAPRGTESTPLELEAEFWA